MFSEKQSQEPTIGAGLDFNTRTELLTLAQRVSKQENRGEIYQHRFEAALAKLQANGTITSWNSTKQYDKLDQAGTDYLLGFKGLNVPFQIISSFHNMNSERRRRKRVKLEKAEICMVSLMAKEKTLREVKDLVPEIQRKLGQYAKNHRPRTDEV